MPSNDALLYDLSSRFLLIDKKELWGY